MQKINILGTEYIIYDDKKDDRFINQDAFCDSSTKEILIHPDILKPKEESKKDLSYYKRQVLRHEIIHAYLYESGLDTSSMRPYDWATNEEMIDWFAIQSPKILTGVSRLDILLIISLVT